MQRLLVLNLFISMLWPILNGDYTLRRALYRLCLRFRPDVACAAQIRLLHSAAARFTANVLYAILLSNLRLAAIVLSYTVGTAPKLRPGIVAVPLTITNPFDITILATVITLTPGTLSVDLGEDVSGRLWPYSESDDGMIGLDADEEPQSEAHEQPEAARSPQSASARDRGAAALLVHAIDVADPQAFRVEIKQNFERPLLELRRILVELDAADT